MIAKSEVNDEIGLRRLLGVPVGVGEAIDEVRKIVAEGIGRGGNIHDSTNIVMLSLSKSGIEEESRGVISNKVDDADGDVVVPIR